MSSLRRRLFKDGTGQDGEGNGTSRIKENSSEINNDHIVHDHELDGDTFGKGESVVDDIDVDNAKEYRVVPAARLRSLERPKGVRRRYAWIFILGGIFGLTIAAFFADRGDILDLTSFTGVHLESIYEVLPAGFVKDARELQVCLLIALVKRHVAIIS